MKQFAKIILLLIAMVVLLPKVQVLSQTEIWKESFTLAEKGYWGGGSDMSGVTWTLDISSCTLSNSDDYIKTVATSGGRMQAVDIDGEAVWTSENIDISGYSNISVSVDLSETGNSTNANKYVNIYYRIDSGTETIFATNGTNVGNFGSVSSSQIGLNGNNLQIIVRINNPNSGDKTIFDNIVVGGTPNGNNSDSQLTSGSQSEPTEISSTHTSLENSLQVFDFTFTDAGSGDNLPTVIKELNITQGADNHVSDWEKAIEGARLYGADISPDGIEASISSDKLHFEISPSISISDGGNESYSIKIFLKPDLSEINDNDTLDFSLDCNNITTDAGGSSFAVGNISSGAIKIAINATGLQFQKIDTMIFSNSNFNLAISAIDSNGNIDKDFNQSVSISTSEGNLTAASGLSKTSNSGIVQWSDLQSNSELEFKIIASSSGLSSCTSSNILSVNPVGVFSTDFEDGNLNGWWYTNDWTNSNISPISGNNSLKHNLQNVKGKSCISHNLKQLSLESKTVIWSFNLKNGNWDPTTQNGFWFYLLANDKNLLSDTIDGYAVGVQLDAKGSKDSLKLWKVTDGKVDTTLLTSNFDWGSSDELGIKVERSTAGEWTLIYSENTEFSSPQIVGSVINNDYDFHDCCGLVFKFLGSTYRSGELWFDDIRVSLDSKDSQLTSGSQSEPTEISSTHTSLENSLQVFDFTFTDAGSGDNLPTVIKELNITQGADNHVSDWEKAIEGARLYGADISPDGIEASISSDKLHFEISPSISISDGGNESYSIKIFLKPDLSEISDNDTLDFSLDCNNITTDAGGSSFAVGNISSGAIKIAINATGLQFQKIDTMIFSNSNFNLSISAIDSNGNIDKDFNQSVSISTAEGNLTAASGLSKTSNSGIVQWSDLQSNSELEFKIIASSSGLSSCTSSNILSVNPVGVFSTDFEDGNLNGWWYTNDWTNSNISPISGNNSLKHNLQNVKGKSCISHNLKNLSLESKTVIWSFNLKNGNWDPTTQNGFWFYLLANDNNLLSDTIDGYAVGVQLDAKGSKDSLKLWKVTDGKVDTTLLTSNFDWGSSDELGIKVERSTAGEWTLSYSENTEFSSPQIVGSVTNNDYDFHDCCGLVFKFLGSNYRAGELWLDDIRVSLDTIPPQISKILVNNENEITLKFTEIIDKNTAENTENFTIDNFGKPSTAKLLSNGYSVILNFNKNFEAKKEYSLSVFNIKDLSSNVIDSAKKNFVYIPFVIENLYMESKNELILEFSHKLDKISSKTLENFSINNEIGNPTFIKMLSDTVLSLLFPDFQKNTKYSLNVSNIKSKEGVIIKPQNIDFEYYPGNANDIVINEIMADVSPAPAVLPNFKYIELYNRSENSIDLSSWKIQLGNKKPKQFKQFIIKPKSYLLLCSHKYENDFLYYGNSMGILSESQLIASGTQILLMNGEGNTIDYVKYSENWYTDNSKKTGGWSLERIDKNNFCGTIENWTASMDYKGGTPCTANSVNKQNPDKKEFKLLKIKAITPFKVALNFNKNVEESEALNPINYQLNKAKIKPLFVSFSDTSRTTIVLQFATQFANGKENSLTVSNLKDFCDNLIKPTTISFSYFLIYPIASFAESSKFVKIIFSEEVEIVTAQNTSNYVVDKGMGSPKSAYKHAINRNEVFLEFTNDFKNQTEYKLSIKNIKDLYGNFIEPANLQFVYFVPTNNDLIINELLFNPKPEGVDFVEIYNKAQLPVDLNKMCLAKRNENGEIESKKQLAENNNMFEPGIFLCISSDTSKTKTDYPSSRYDKFLQIPTLPAYNDDKGNVILMYGDSIIDEFSYNEKMHFALISKNEGISLERIDPLKPSDDYDNWHSAATTVGFATPANKNSQYKMLAKTISEEIHIEPETFSPDNDGHDDVVFVRYKFPEPGYVANVTIYNSKGILIKRLAQNELLANEGEFSWDGLRMDNTKSQIGIYVIHFEVFNLDGIVKQTKKVCVLAGRLN